MRNTLLVGFGVALGAVLAVLGSAAFDLELEAVTLLGVAAGAVVALVPDRTLAARLTGFLAGFAVSWSGYAVRAALLPDSAAGKATVAGLVIVAATLVAAATAGRMPLWSTLFGAALFAGAYEAAYAAAPPEFSTTSVSTATATLLSLAVGFLAAAALDRPQISTPASSTDRESLDTDGDDNDDSVDVAAQTDHPSDMEESHTDESDLIPMETVR